MNRKPEHLIYRWLRLMKIPVSASYLKQQLLSHPDYPSLVSITDTLDELNIENTSLIVDKEKLNEVPVPFLAHTVLNGGEFELVTNIKKHLEADPHFKTKWDGIVVVAEKLEHLEDPENEKLLQEEKGNQRMLWFFAFFIFGLSLFSIANNFFLQYLSLLITSVAGLGIAVLIVLHELGISNEFTEQLCAAGKNTDCDTVMKSKGSRFLKWFNWADAGIIYFSSVFLLSVISAFNGIVTQTVVILSLLSILSLPFTVYSIYYQWHVVKKWCPLCLATVAILWIQFGTTLSPELAEGAKGNFTSFPINTSLFTLFIFSTTTALWLLLIKPALQKNKELNDKNFSLLRFKNNPEIFNALLREQRTVDATPFENDLQLGNPDADPQIIVACNPYCGPCAQTHELLHELAEKNDIGMTVRFAIKTANKDDKKLLAVEYILQVLRNKKNAYKRKVMHDWYADMNFEKFSRKYPFNSNEEIDELLKKQEEWSDKSEIKFTPTIFINGYELPRQYGARDLKIMFRNIEKTEAINQQKHIDENEFIPV